MGAFMEYGKSGSEVGNRSAIEIVGLWSFLNVVSVDATGRAGLLFAYGWVSQSAIQNGALKKCSVTRILWFAKWCEIIFEVVILGLV
jgi:hypothetical protein